MRQVRKRYFSADHAWAWSVLGVSSAMLLVPAIRDEVIALLPKGGVVAEVGVAFGDFSEVILARTSPTRLHLIDPWAHQATEAYASDPANFDQLNFDRTFHDVTKRFAGQSQTGLVSIERGLSVELAPRYADGYFDWVYIDAMHTRDAVLADLRAFAPKVKPDGFILGHDYANHAEALAMGFGVVEAVNEFVRETGYSLVALTNCYYPTYAIAKAPQSTACRDLVGAIAAQLPVTVDIAWPERKQYKQTYIEFGPNNRRVITTFG